MMPETRRYFHPSVAALCLLCLTAPALAQDLDPRAYARVPVDMNFAIGGFSYSDGSVVTDATSVIQNGHATVEAVSLGVGRTFSLFDRTAQVFAALPYSWAQASADVGGQPQSITRSGFADMRLRFSLLILGAPAAKGEAFAKIPHQTIVGASLTVAAPVGQYFPEKLVNLGTHRWAFKPELAVSQPLGSRWLFDVYSAICLFTANDSYYPGDVRRTQDPLIAFQAHVSYSFQPRLWLAFDMTYYTGGQSYADGRPMDDRQYNMRIGSTMVLPVGERHAVKISGSTGAVVRIGARFTTLAIGWQTVVF
jgi:hypothetical protein